MNPLKKRLIISFFLVSLTLYAIFWAPIWFFFLMVWIIGLVGLHEYLDLVIKKSVEINRPLVLALGALIPFSVFDATESFILSLACLLLLVFHFNKRLRQNALLGTAATFFGLVYVSWFFSHLIKIRMLPDGPVWVFYTLLLVKGGDAGAYFVGRKLGRHKLIEHISPNKSVEGAVGGFLTTLMLSILAKTYLPEIAFLHVLILGVTVGVLSQFGDLAESLLKRDAGVKDSGLIPGLGGILDVLDSLLITIPFVYYYLSAVSSGVFS